MAAEPQPIHSPGQVAPLLTLDERKEPPSLARLVVVPEPLVGIDRQGPMGSVAKVRAPRQAFIGIAEDVTHHGLGNPRPVDAGHGAASPDQHPLRVVARGSER